jgi:putative tricarboxylic transport membrane protein
VLAAQQVRVAGVVAAAIGILTAFAASDLGLGSLTAPGPGLWPLVVGLVLAISGAAVALRPGDDAEPIDRDAWIVGVACLSLALYTLVIEIVGFEVPTLLLLAFWLRGLGRESWRTTVLVSVGATAVVWVVFILALDVALPHLA